MTNFHVTGKVVGGFGNQLFIAAAAMEQAKRLGVDCRLDTSWYSNNRDRTYLLDLLKLPADAISPSRSNLFTSIMAKKTKQKTFREHSFDFDPKVFEVGANTFLEGYFQSPRYFESVSSIIVDALVGAKVSQEEERIIRELSAEPFIALHVRRGDYVANHTANAYHGVCSPEYFEKALKIAREQFIVFPKVLVFTDSPEMVKRELAHLKNLIFVSDVGELEEIATIQLMSRASFLVTSNSTFSWWAAWICSKLDETATIIAPEPWFANGIGTLDLIPQHWTRVPAR